MTLKEIRAKYPTLCATGLGISNFKPRSPYEKQLAELAESRRCLFDSQDEIHTARAFLALCRPSRSRCGSYGLKHQAEGWGARSDLSPYVSNGALILAAYLLDYDVRPDDERSLSLEWLGHASPNAAIALRVPKALGPDYARPRRFR